MLPVYLLTLFRMQQHVNGRRSEGKTEMGWMTHRITGAGDSCHIAKEKAANGKNRGRGLEMLLAVKLDHIGNNFLRRQDWTLPGGMQHCNEEMTPAGISYSSCFSNTVHDISQFLQDSSLSTSGFL